MLSLHAGYRRTIPCQAARCHSREGGNPSLDLSFPPRGLLFNARGVLRGASEGCSRRRNVIPECFCRGRESTSPSWVLNLPLLALLPADPVSVDERITRLVVAWREKGREPQLDELLILSFLREHPSIDTRAASSFLQLGIEEARSMLEVMTTATPAFLERQGRMRAATFALSPVN